MEAGPGAFWVGEEEKKEVLEVLDSGYVVRYGSEDDPTYKQKTYTLEKELAKLIGVKHAIAVNSGTSALFIGLSALGIGAGDEVIVPGYTFIASFSSTIYARGIPVLAEIDESLTIDPEDVKKKITPKTKAIIAVNMLGNPCNFDALQTIARENNLYLIEDSCQSVGGSYKGKRLGSLGDVSAFSLNWYKTITTGDGGAFLTDDSEIYEKAFGTHDQGHKPNRAGIEIGRRSVIGINLRVNELTGAFALAQLRKLDNIIATLREKKKKLKDALLLTDKMAFRRINDEGECGTLLTLIFKEKTDAECFAEKLGVRTLSYSGWHVYANMEQLMGKNRLADFDKAAYSKDIEYNPGMLPQTDDILSRTINISVGVVDRGIGAGFGITINATDAEIKVAANRINEAIASL